MIANLPFIRMYRQIGEYLTNKWYGPLNPTKCETSAEFWIEDLLVCRHSVSTIFVEYEYLQLICGFWVSI